MTAFTDARTLADGTEISPDLVIIGGGPAGISLGLALKDTPFSILILEGGGLDFDPATQALYKGAESGEPYVPLDQGRLRFLGVSSNHCGGFCRPLDPIDFEERSWVSHSGWPFGLETVRPYFARAPALVAAGPWIYDAMEQRLPAGGRNVLPLGQGGVYTSWFQFSMTQNGGHATYFGQRYGEDLKAAARIKLWLNAGVTNLTLAHDAGRLEQLSVATLDGKRFTVKPRFTVLAAGAMENARLLLASNDVMKPGVGNQNDQVGRFFADHPIPRNTATLVLFDGQLAPFYLNTQDMHGAVMRAWLFQSEDYRRKNAVMDSSTTIEHSIELDQLGNAAVAATASALGVDAGNAAAYSLGCGMEVTPDPNRRLTLDTDRDALGMPRLKLHMRIADSDFAHFRETLKELGRQLLASRTGMLRRTRLRRTSTDFPFTD